MSSESAPVVVSPTTQTPPKYCRQRCKGRPDRAYVRLSGKKIMLGKYGSDVSRQKYVKLISKAGSELSQVAEVSKDPIVAEVLVAYLEHARIYYALPNGSPGREYEQICDVGKHLRKVASGLPALNFGPLKLKEVRQSLIDADLSRRFINKQVGRVVRIFKWAASEELVPVTVHTALATVDGLKRGRTRVRETEPIEPVSDSDVEATLAHLPQTIADMVRLQRLTAMRAGELVQMRPLDIDRSTSVWTYRPAVHKTQHHGKDRVVAIGPKSQAILLSYLARDKEMHLFRPCDSEAKRLAVRSSKRGTPMSCGNIRGSNRKANPRRQPGTIYSVASYRRCIKRAAIRAGVAHWTPHRLRHTAATEIRKDFGLEHAQVVLGHAQASITEVYAERDLEKASEVAKRIG